MSFGDDIFSSEGSSIDDGYSTLEKRIYNWKWEQSPKFGEEQEPERNGYSVKFRPWQKNAINMLSNRLGSDTGWIRFCAFAHGIKVLRDELYTDLWNHVRTIKEWAHWIMTDYSNISSRGNEIMDLVELNPEPDPVSTGKVNIESSNVEDDPTTVMMIPNDKRHIETEYVEGGFVRGWIYREIISLGLSESELLPSMYSENCSEMRETVPLILQHSYKKIGDSLSTFIQKESNHWIDNGIHESALTDMEIVAAKMPDARQEIIKSILSRVRELADVIPHEDCDYDPILIDREDDRDKLQHDIGYYYGWL